MSDIIKRYGLWAVIAVFVAGVALRPDVLNTSLIATVAVMLTVILAEAVQYIFTRIDWTNQQYADLDPEKFNEVVIASKIRTLGAIYLGVALVIGCVFLGVYFTQWIPGVAQ